MTRALALIAAAVVLPAAAAADSRFDLPRISAASASPESSEAVLVDRDSGRRTRLAIGDRYGGTYRLVEIDRERVVLRRVGDEPIYYVLPVRSAEEVAAPALAPINPYDRREVRRVLAPERSRADAEVKDPYAERDGDASSGERRPELKDPYTGRDEPSPAAESPPRPELKNPYADNQSAGSSERRPEAKAPHAARASAPERPDRRARPAAASRRVSRSRLDEEMADFQALERQVAVRAERGGVRITSLEPGSLLHDLGLRRGDLVRRVAGRRIDSAGAAAALYAHLARADEVSVEIERGGRELVLRYELVP